MKKYNMTEEMAENGSLWNMKIKSNQLLHGGHRGEGEKKIRFNITHSCGTLK